LLRGIFRTKNLDDIMAAAGGPQFSLRRTLGAFNVTLIGIGAIVGAGIFATVGTAAAGDASRPGAGASLMLSFVITAVVCAFTALCYAEFASMVPISGSAYTYSYATLGEFVAWIIGWDLILEYAVAAATVASAWSEYANRVLDWFGWRIPFQWSHTPFQHDAAGTAGIINIPAVFILFLLTLLLIRGTKESAFVNGLIVILKVTIVLLVIGLGWGFINPANHTPFIPAATTYTTSEGITHPFGGIMGILGAAGVVFFAYIGFDAVSTAAQEARNPKRDMPIGILGSLAVCTVLYVLFSYVLGGLAPVADFRDPLRGGEASVAYAISTYMHGYEWLSKCVTVAILAGFSSVILVMLLGQSRVFFSMSRDGLVPRIFSDVHPRYRTPYKSNVLFFVFTGAMAAFVPADITGEMTSIGTLFAFILVCIGVWIIRVQQPQLERGFRVPMVPVVSSLGIIVCAAMIYGLGWTNWLRLIIWLIIGLVFYFSYGRKHSRLGAPIPPEMPEGISLHK
jgi:basic amino acid/polyamine antiporter, APA family